MGLSILVQIKRGVCRGEYLGCLVRETYTSTGYRSDRRTQQSRDFSVGEKERRVIRENRLEWAEDALGREKE